MAAHPLEEIILEDDVKELDAKGQSKSKESLIALYQALYDSTHKECEIRKQWEFEVYQLFTDSTLHPIYRMHGSIIFMAQIEGM